MRSSSAEDVELGCRRTPRSFLSITPRVMNYKIKTLGIRVPERPAGSAASL